MVFYCYFQLKIQQLAIMRKDFLSVLDMDKSRLEKFKKSLGKLSQKIWPMVFIESDRISKTDQERIRVVCFVLTVNLLIMF